MQLYMIRYKKNKEEVFFDDQKLICNNIPALHYLVKTVREKIRPFKRSRGSIFDAMEIVDIESGEVVETIPEQED